MVSAVSYRVYSVKKSVYCRGLYLLDLFSRDFSVFVFVELCVEVCSRGGGCPVNLFLLEEL